MYCVGGKVVAAAKRIAAHVVGDGVSTIKQLIDAKNKDPRRGEGHSAAMSFIVDQDVREALLLKTSDKVSDPLLRVPADGVMVALYGVANLSQGGESVDVTDIIHPTVRSIAERFAAASGCGVCGVDLLSTDISKSAEEGDAVVIEINAGPGLRMHTMAGTGRHINVASFIWDELLAQRNVVPYFG